jgi:threonine/homoserine/homoserine lactone efflux protein
VGRVSSQGKGRRLRRNLAIFASAFVIGLSGAMMPGPLLAASIYYAKQGGFLAGGPLLVLGHALLELALVLLVFVGLGPLLSRPRVGAAIGIVGGAVLLWMGYGMTASAIEGIQLVTDQSEMPLLTHPILAGALVSLSNPYWSLWWATIGLKYISLSREAGRAGVAAFYCGHQLSDVSWYFLVAGAVALGRKAISNLAYRWIVGCCGVVLVAFGIYFIVGAILSVAKARNTLACATAGPGPSGAEGLPSALRIADCRSQIADCNSEITSLKSEIRVKKADRGTTKG